MKLPKKYSSNIPLLALAELFLSHGVSFVHNYLLKGEYASANTQKLMTGPIAG